MSGRGYRAASARIADLVPERGREALQRRGWPQEQMVEKDFAKRLKRREHLYLQMIVMR